MKMIWQKAPGIGLTKWREVVIIFLKKEQIIITAKKKLLSVIRAIVNVVSLVFKKINCVFIGNRHDENRKVVNVSYVNYP